MISKRNKQIIQIEEIFGSHIRKESRAPRTNNLKEVKL